MQGERKRQTETEPERILPKLRKSDELKMRKSYYENLAVSPPYASRKGRKYIAADINKPKIEEYFSPALSSAFVRSFAFYTVKVRQYALRFMCTMSM